MLRKLRFVVSPTFDPVVRSFSVVPVLLQRRDHFGNVVDDRNRARHSFDGHGDVRRVGVDIYESGQDGPAVEINRLITVDVLRVSRPGDLAAGNSERSHEVRLIPAREDLPIDENLFVV